MRGRSPDTLSTLLARSLAACSQTIAAGMDSALVAASAAPAAEVAKGGPAPSRNPGAPAPDGLIEALSQRLEQWGLNVNQLGELERRLTSAQALTPKAKTLIKAALTNAGRATKVGASNVQEEVDLDELVSDLAKRLTGISADLMAVTELWDQTDEGARAALLDQLRYYAELHAYYAGDRRSKDAGDGRVSVVAENTKKRSKAKGK